MEGNEVTYRAIYTHLDALLDTRMKTIEIIYPEVYNDLKRTKSYLQRVSDVIPMDGYIFDMKMIAPYYARRKPQILLDSEPTNIFVVISRLFTDYINSIDVNNPNNDFRLVVNTYPYIVQPEMLAELLIRFTSVLDVICKVDFIYHDPHIHSLEDLREYNIIDMIVYDGYSWLTKLLYRSKVLETTNIPDMQLITTRPLPSLSRHPGLLNNRAWKLKADPTAYDIPVKDEQWSDMMHMIIRNQILEFDMFSYIEVEDA